MDRILLLLAPFFNAIFSFGVPLSIFLIVGLLIYLLLPRMYFLDRIGRRRRGDKRREEEGKRVVAAKNKAIEAEEFVDAMGVTRSRYLRLTFMITLTIAALSFAVLQSVVVSGIAAFTFFRWRTGQASGRLTKLRAGLLADEVLPMSRTISSSLSTGMSLSQSLSDATRGDRGKSSPLKIAIRRALADARGLEEGLRDEETRARQDLIKEFFEILADGATVARNQAATADTMEKFSDINQRQRTQYQLALRVTGQARGTRTMLVTIIPFVMAGAVLVSGPELMLHTVGGQAVILAAFGMVMIAIGLTNRMISGVTKGF